METSESIQTVRAGALTAQKVAMKKINPRIHRREQRAQFELPPQESVLVIRITDPQTGILD
jgi:hypothetical protein